jgi:ketosteroid isomerase-like protein
LPSKNSELIRAGYEAWNRDDRDAWLDALHADVEFQTSGVWPDFDTVYRGRQGLAEFWRRMHEPWEKFRIDIEQIDEEGDCYTVALRFRAKGIDSGLEVDMRFANAIRVRDGLQIEVISRHTVEEAREALRQGPRDAIEVVSATYAAWNAGDWGLERIHPHIEWELTGKAALDQNGPTRGRDALLDYWRRFWGAWKPGAPWEIEELLPLGHEQVLACGRLRAAGRSSGVEVSAPFFQLWTVREGLIVRLLICDDRATALKAAGS